MSLRDMYEADPDLLTEPLPTELWVELTSRCPFDCVFCSRRLRRGEGEHMDFALYHSLLAQLAFPEVIRLNYSGESIHYPRLEEVIALARSTGARTELVTALASADADLVARLAGAGLDCLTVSLHTLDEQQFREIYGFGSLAELRARVEEFLRLGSASQLDFAFVAMERNLGQLEPLAAYARTLEVRRILVCPVIKRDPVPAEFTAELDAEHRLTGGFRSRLRAEVQRTRRRYEELEIIVANPEVEGAVPVPEEAPLRSCEQNPWSTMHVLSNGDVVACEAHDRTPLGSLATQSLQDIWWGAKYREFRRRYRAGSLPGCRRCPWKIICSPGPLHSSIRAEDGVRSQLLAGWHAGPDPGVVWSKPDSTAVLAPPGGARRLRVRGILPPRCAGLEIFANQRRVGSVANPSDALAEFERGFGVAASGDDVWLVRFRTREPHCPARDGVNPDSRKLGFALIEVSAELAPRRWGRLLKTLAVAPPFALLSLADRVCRRLRPWLPRREPVLRRREAGLSVLIPERDTPQLLARCLASLGVAVRHVPEPVEVVVVVNGSPPADYMRLVERHPEVRWLWFEKPLGFSSAVRAGLRQATCDWVYLLNSDMLLQPETLQLLLPLRAPEVFAVASQIVPLSPGGRREETNWTDWRFPGGVVEIYDAPPEEDAEAYDSLYAGGGSSLFHRALLARLVKRAGDAYDPFYWEDVEWGVAARKRGYRVLFCPASKVFHVRRATIAKHYAPQEVERIFTRNGYLFQMRNVTAAGSLAALARRVASADRRTILELLAPRVFLRALLARLRAHFLPLDDRDLCGIRRAGDRCTIAP